MFLFMKKMNHTNQMKVKYIYYKLFGLYYKLLALYYTIILRIFYNRKPNPDGTFDLQSSPSFKNAKL